MLAHSGLLGADVQSPRFGPNRSSGVVSLENTLRLFLVHGIGHSERQHISNSNRYGGRGRGRADAKGDLLELVDGCREQDGVRAFAEQRALGGVRVRCDGDDGRV